MNRTFKKVWSKALGRMVVVSQLVKGGVSSTSRAAMSGHGADDCVAQSRLATRLSAISMGQGSSAVG